MIPLVAVLEVRPSVSERRTRGMWTVDLGGFGLLHLLGESIELFFSDNLWLLSPKDTPVHHPWISKYQSVYWAQNNYLHFFKKQTFILILYSIIQRNKKTLKNIFSPINTNAIISNRTT